MATAEREHTEPAALAPDDLRLARPIFTLRETGGYLGVAKSTLHQWARPTGDRSPLITVFPAHGREATVPFIGFAEAFVLSAFRRAGVPLQRGPPGGRRAVARDRPRTRAGVGAPLHRGAEVLFDFATERRDDELLELVVVRTGQKQFSELIRAYLQRITYGHDGWASQVQLPIYGRARVIVDPHSAFGLPLVTDGGARVEDLVDRFLAGDTISDIADDFGVPFDHVEDVIRVATRTAA